MSESNLFSIPDFGVSSAILNTIDIFRMWCKLNFRPLRGQVKSRHLLERIDARRQQFYFIQISWNNWAKTTWEPFWIMIWIYYYHLTGIILDLDLDNPSQIRKIPNFATNNINISVFHAPHIACPREIKLAKFDCITKYLTDNSSKFSDLSNRMYAYNKINLESSKLVQVFFKPRSRI